MMMRLCLLMLLVCASPVFAKTPPLCADDALKQAKKLLSFHVDGDDRAAVDAGSVKALPSIQNPVAHHQQFHVLEVYGSVYKGQYRMRFIYYLLKVDPKEPVDCVLMGQEILEFARL